MGKRGRKPSGKVFNCKQCGKEFYRSPQQIKNGANQTCSNECRYKYFSGKRNWFWNRSHTEETKAKISASRKGKCLGNQHAKGHKHSEEAKKRISAASKRLWENQRDKMIDSLPKGWNNAMYKPPTERRHRIKFSPKQRREWMDDKCAFCGHSDDLVLDHIIPVFDGGKNVVENAQTLCRPCNLWKTYKVDLPRYYAKQGVQRDH